MNNDTGLPAGREKPLSASPPVYTVPQARAQRRGHLARHSDHEQKIAYGGLAKREPLIIWLALIGIVITAAIFVLYGLTRSPATWDDEVFFAETRPNARKLRFSVRSDVLRHSRV